jgi:hypothetical protein
MIKYTSEMDTLDAVKGGGRRKARVGKKSAHGDLITFHSKLKDAFLYSLLNTQFKQAY